MSGSVTREVILKLRLQMAEQGFKIPQMKAPAPDMSHVTTAAAGFKWPKVKMPKLDMTEFERSLKKAADDASGAYVNLDRQAAEARSQFELNHQGGKRSPTETGTNSEIVGKMRIAADAYKVAGEGALHLARGIAFLNAESEEDLAKVVRRIAYYTGLFDIFKGGVDVTKGAIVGTRAIAAAHTAAAAATAAHARFAAGHAAALTTSTVVMNATAAAATRMWAALMGPIGWAALAAGVAYGAVQWGIYRKSVEDAADETVRALKEQITLTGMAKGRQDDLNRSIEAGAKFRAQTALNSEIHGINQGLVGNLSGAALGATQDAQRRADLEAKANTFADRRFNIAKAMTQLQQRAGQLGEIGTKSSVLSEESLRQNIEQQRALVDAQKAMNALRKEDLATVTEQRNAVAALHDSERQRFAANKIALKEEEDRKKSLTERFGELRPDQQQRIKDIAGRVQSGGVEGLRRDERDFLKETGFADSLLSKFNLKRGQDAGFGEVAKQLGTFLPGTRDLAEGQGANQTREDFLKSQRAEITRGFNDAKQEWERLGEVQKLLADATTDGLKNAVKTGEEVLRAMEAQLEALRKQAADAAVIRKQAEDLRAAINKAETGRLVGWGGVGVSGS